ncbi:hypothetical protein ACFLW2_03045 [Chloroflexota bacterium]
MNKGGAPRGNQNARKHGFYSKYLTDTEELEMKEAKGIEGLDDELSLLRVKLGRLLDNQPDRVDLHLRAVGMIARLTRSRDGLTMTKNEGLQCAINNILTEVGVPLGLKLDH